MMSQKDGGIYMNILFVVLNIVALLLLVGVLIIMQKKHVSFSKRVFTALGLGIVFGLVLNFVYGVDSEVLAETVPWYNLIGTGYVKLITNDCYAISIHLYFRGVYENHNR